MYTSGEGQGGGRKVLFGSPSQSALGNFTNYLNKYYFVMDLQHFLMFFVLCMTQLI